MGTVIPFVGYYTYKLIAGKSPIASNLRIAAAAIAGYVGLSVAAGVAGFEMGIQPILEHTAAGVPLYMPYGLNVTIPAMLIDHMGFFSLGRVDYHRPGVCVYCTEQSRDHLRL